MRLVLTKKRSEIITGVLVTAGLFAVLSFYNPARAQLASDRPYFRAEGSDIFAGGWFNSGNVACSTERTDPGDYFQAPNYSSLPATKFTGGILAYTDFDIMLNQASGASSEFAAMALGLIEGQLAGGEPYGIYSGGSSYNTLSFANLSSQYSGGDYWGGLFEGTTAQARCIPDYFGTKQNGTPPQLPNSDVSTLNSNQYTVTPSGIQTISSSGVIGQSKHITIFVDGDVYIESDITYDSRNNYTADTSPKFALVVRGNIYVSPDVEQLDGLYITQPDTRGNNPNRIDASGVFWTCHDNSASTTLLGTWIRDNCEGNDLVINGALIAKQVNLMRISGDIQNRNRVAETFNYTPEMVLGGPFFDEEATTGSEIQSLINLPPVF